MEQGTFDLAEEASPAPAKLCDCGCGEPAPIAPRNNKRRGWIKGEPIRFIWGHGRRKPAKEVERRESRIAPPLVRKSSRPGRQPKVFVEVGQRFGRGVVIDPEVRVANSSSTGSCRGALLRCDCPRGTEYAATISSLMKGNTKSCGCLAVEVGTEQGRRGRGRLRSDKTGERFGKLLVLQLVEIVDGQARWLCRCDCGNEPTVWGSNLNTKSGCGCGQSAPRGTRDPGEAARKHVLRQYQQNAKRRGRVWELTDEDFDRLTSSDCYYCGIAPCRVFSTGKYEGAEFTYNGIDRVDSAGDYTPENVVPCCNTCNVAKRDMSFDTFMEWIGRLVAHQWLRPEMLPSAAIARPALRVVNPGDVA